MDGLESTHYQTSTNEQNDRENGPGERAIGMIVHQQGSICTSMYICMLAVCRCL